MYSIKLPVETLQDLLEILGSKQLITTGVSYESSPLTKDRKVTISYIEADTELEKSLTLVLKQD